MSPRRYGQKPSGEAECRWRILTGLCSIHQHALPSGEVSQFMQEQGLEALQAGDTECLYLCQQLSVPTLLTDDLSVRVAAKRLLITPVGSLELLSGHTIEGTSPSWTQNGIS